jgi:hypothetical protein
MLRLAQMEQILEVGRSLPRELQNMQLASSRLALWTILDRPSSLSSLPNGIHKITIFESIRRMLAGKYGRFRTFTFTEKRANKASSKTLWKTKFSHSIIDLASGTNRHLCTSRNRRNAFKKLIRNEMIYGLRREKLGFAPEVLLLTRYAGFSTRFHYYVIKSIIYCRDISCRPSELINSTSDEVRV